MKFSPLDFSQIGEEFKQLISNIFFEGQEPTWLSPLINAFLLAVLILLGLWGLLFVVSKIRKIWIEEFWPLFYQQEQKRRRLQRQRFAEHIEYQIRQLNSREEWKDYRFTELEAEIEAEGKWKKSTIIPFVQTTQRGLRREKSLSKGLEISTERLILVEGEPGSGKSVALRHVTQKLANQASKSNNLKSVIPLYINLKKLERDSQPIDRNLIEDFVKKELNRINDRDIEEFLDNEFYRGVKEGTWLFLFDSFDELPEVLSSVESDEVIRSYAEAIDAFLHSLNNQCRGIIASRQFRGPKHLGWPRFRILPLENRRLELIRKADLDPPVEQELIKQWRNASPDIQQMTKNPMFLSILCENMRDGIPFPKNTHSVFEIYLNKRLTRDQERLKKRFNLEPTEVRAIAEQVAFCMTLDQNLGLSPTRNAIRQGMRNAEFRVPGHFDKLLDALEYLKLTRSEEETIEEDKKFTFSHRRFQEYFATCVVLRDLERISPKQLLKDGRWRETTVVIFQTQPSETFTPILTEADNMLTEMVGNISELIDDPLTYVEDESPEKYNYIPKPFSWPDGVIHLLGILQDGFRSRLEDLGDNIQYQAECLLLSATVKGTLRDRKWGLEVAGVTSQPILVWLLRNAFVSDSQWLKEVAYQQTARLDKIPDDIAADIRRTLLRLFATGRLYKERFTTESHLCRLDNSEHYLNVFRLLRWIKPIDLCLCLIIFIILIYQHNFLINHSHLSLLIFFWEIFLLLCSYKTLQYFSSFLSSIKFSFFTKNIENYYLNDIIQNKLSLLLLLMYLRFLSSPIIMWSVFAIIAAYNGKFTYPFWWFFLMAVPILYLISEFKIIIKNTSTNIINIINLFRQDILVIYLLVFIIFTFLMYMIVILFFQNISVIFFTKISNTLWFSILVLFSVTIGFIVLIVYSLYGFYQTFQDLIFWSKKWRKWKKWVTKKHLPNSIIAEDILNYIKFYNDEVFYKQLIIYSREKNLIIANQKSEKLLTEFAVILERSILLRYTKEEDIEEFSSSEFLRNLLKQYISKDNQRLAKLGSEFLDELYKLIEQIRVRQKTPENQNN